MSVSHPTRLRYLLDGQEELGVSYDEQADILYLWRGDAPRDAISITSEEGHLVRIDPETGEIAGFTIFDFQVAHQEPDEEGTSITVSVPSVDVAGHARKEPQTHELVPA